MTLASATILASLVSQGYQTDPRQTVAEFLAALNGSPVPEWGQWIAAPSMAESLSVSAGDHGWARIRGDDGRLISWSVQRPGSGHNDERRPPPTSYLDETDVRGLVTGFLQRWIRSDLEIREVTIERDSESPIGDFVRGRASVRLGYKDDPPFAGPHRRGAYLVFDAATGQPLLAKMTDRMVAIRGTDGVSEEEAVRIANEHTRESGFGETTKLVGTKMAYCASLKELVEALEHGGNPIYADSLNAYWCLVATYSDPPGSWVAVRMSDGKVLWASLSP
ncbi:MAG: hypothetical protein IT207_02585 [Fimbriimonadaceae bacterium]|nr:hypothetical protein [Fimbriimonadaceae bacterium]